MRNLDEYFVQLHPSQQLETISSHMHTLNEFLYINLRCKKVVYAILDYNMIEMHTNLPGLSLQTYLRAMMWCHSPSSTPTEERMMWRSSSVCLPRLQRSSTFPSTTARARQSPRRVLRPFWNRIRPPRDRVLSLMLYLLTLCAVCLQNVSSKCWNNLPKND